MTKTNQMRTKRKQKNEAEAAEDRREIDDFLATEYLNRAKAREILEEYMEGKENTGERND